MAKLHLFRTNRAKGAKVFIPGLGEFANGEVHDVESLEEDVYVPPRQEESDDDDDDDDNEPSGEQMHLGEPPVPNETDTDNEENGDY